MCMLSVQVFLRDGVPKHVGVEWQRLCAITHTGDEEFGPGDCARVSTTLWGDCGAVLQCCPLCYSNSSVARLSEPGPGLEEGGCVLCPGSREFDFATHGYFRLEVVPKSFHWKGRVVTVVHRFLRMGCL